MSKIERRRFLFGGGAIVLAAITTKLGAFKFFNDNSINDFHIFWNKTQNISASTYLKSVGIDEGCSESLLNSIINLDFYTENTLIYKGLILSKTEVAILAEFI